MDQYEKNQIKVIEKNRLQRKAMESILDKKESTLITLLQGDSVRTQKSKQNEKNKIWRSITFSAQTALDGKKWVAKRFQTRSDGLTTLQGSKRINTWSFISFILLGPYLHQSSENTKQTVQHFADNPSIFHVVMDPNTSAEILKCCCR